MMSRFQRGDLVRLRLNDDVFEVVEVLPSGMLRISNPQLQLATSADGVEAVKGELDQLPTEPPEKS